MDADDTPPMTWAKTDAGRTEMQARALVRERAQRNLLLVIDGAKSEKMLLANLAGISAQDFRVLESLGLIVPVGGATRPATAAAPGAVAAPAVPAPNLVSAEPLDYAQFTAALTRLISKELGLRGFMLTLAVEKAGTIEELRAVAQRGIEQIRERRGDVAAAGAIRILYGA